MELVKKRTKLVLPAPQIYDQGMHQVNIGRVEKWSKKLILKVVYKKPDKLLNDYIVTLQVSAPYSFAPTTDHQPLDTVVAIYNISLLKFCARVPGVCKIKSILYIVKKGIQTKIYFLSEWKWLTGMNLIIWN